MGWLRAGWVCLTLALASCQAHRAPTSDLAWAYPSGTKSVFGQPIGAGPFHMAGSALTLTGAQIDQADAPIDWFAHDHPAPPAAVNSGPNACAQCHAYNGAGFPGSADLAGLPASYIVEQVAAFKSGERRSADPDAPDTAAMIAAAKAVTPAQVAQAAAYFAALPRTHWLRVVETAMVPRTVADRYGWLDPAPGGGIEPIGDRLVELSDDLPQALLANDHVMLTDYAPPGALARGQAVVASCAACHGAQFRGTAGVPPLAGRPAAYLARTLWDIRVGARRGAAVAAMAGPAQQLPPAQIGDAVAYLASLQP